MKINTLRKSPLFILALVSGFALATGCGDDDNAAPSTTTIEDEDASTTDEPDNTNEADASDTVAESETESDTESDTTNQSDTTNGADASDTTSNNDDGGNNSGETDDGGTGDEDGGTEDSIDAGTDAGPIVEQCVEDPNDGCFSCPQAPEEFLTRCELPGTECRAFDNVERLGRYVVGQPLPTP